MSEEEIEPRREEPEIEAEGADEPVDPRPFILHHLELGEDFLALDASARAELLADIEGAQLRRHLGRAFFFMLLLVTFFLTLQGVLLYVSCGIVAILGGRDLGRFTFKRRLLAAARAWFLDEGAGDD